VVPPAGGLPRAQAVALAEAVAEALRSYDIPASARLGNSQSLVLDLQVLAQGRRILLAANLADPAGVSMLEDQNQGDVPGEPERPESWRAYAQPLARAVVLAMKPETVIARRLPAVLMGGTCWRAIWGSIWRVQACASPMRQATIRSASKGRLRSSKSDPKCAAWPFRGA
jgi:hypothetical protein